MPNWLIAEAIGALVAFIGLVVCARAARYPTQAAIGQLFLVVGLIVMSAGAGIAAPGPVDPIDPDDPAPVTSFGQQVQRTFKGTPDEASTFGALHVKYGLGVAFEGTRPTRAVNTLDDFYTHFAESQRFDVQSETPGNDRFGLSTLKAEEMRKRGVADRATFDVNTRRTACLLWVEVGEALEAIE